MINASERNAIIIKEFGQGQKTSSLAKKYNLSVSAIRRICEKESFQRRLADDLIFRSLSAVNTDQVANIKIYNILVRNGICSFDEFVQLDEIRYIKFRGCGSKYADILYDAIEYAKEN